MEEKEPITIDLTSGNLEECSTEAIAPEDSFHLAAVESQLEDSESNSRSPSPKLALPPIVYHLYILQKGKWIRGYAQGTVMLDISFTEVKDEFTAKLMDKLDLPLEDSNKFKIIFGIKWTVTNTRTTTTAKKSTAPVNPNDFADFKRESCLSALNQTIRGTLKKVRGKLDAGNKQLLVLATITDADSTQTSARAMEKMNLEDEDSILIEENPHVCIPLSIMLIKDRDEFSTQRPTRFNGSPFFYPYQSCTGPTESISLPQMLVEWILFPQRRPGDW